MRIFKDFRELTYEDTEYISLFNFNSEEFLKENNIEYIKDVRGEIIPIGIVDFSKNNLYKKLDYLNLIVNSKEDLYKCNSILRNIDEAIRIKYEEVKFIERFADNWEEVSEEIEL